MAICCSGSDDTATTILSPEEKAHQYVQSLAHYKGLRPRFLEGEGNLWLIPPAIFSSSAVLYAYLSTGWLHQILAFTVNYPQFFTPLTRLFRDDRKAWWNTVCEFKNKRTRASFVDMTLETLKYAGSIYIAYLAAATIPSLLVLTGSAFMQSLPVASIVWVATIGQTYSSMADFTKALKGPLLSLFTKGGYVEFAGHQAFMNVVTNYIDDLVIYVRIHAKHIYNNLTDVCNALFQPGPDSTLLNKIFIHTHAIPRYSQWITPKIVYALIYCAFSITQILSDSGNNAETIAETPDANRAAFSWIMNTLFTSAFSATIFAAALTGTLLSYCNRKQFCNNFMRNLPSTILSLGVVTLSTLYTSDPAMTSINENFGSLSPLLEWTIRIGIGLVNGLFVITHFGNYWDRVRTNWGIRGSSNQTIQNEYAENVVIEFARDLKQKWNDLLPVAAITSMMASIGPLEANDEFNTALTPRMHSEMPWTYGKTASEVGIILSEVDTDQVYRQMVGKAVDRGILRQWIDVGTGVLSAAMSAVLLNNLVSLLPTVGFEGLTNLFPLVWQHEAVLATVCALVAVPMAVMLNTLILKMLECYALRKERLTLGTETQGLVDPTASKIEIGEDSPITVKNIAIRSKVEFSCGRFLWNTCLASLVAGGGMMAVMFAAKYYYCFNEPEAVQTEVVMNAMKNYGFWLAHSAIGLVSIAAPQAIFRPR